MTISNGRVALCGVLLAGWMLNFSMFAGAARGQSDIVFMTADVSPDFQSKLFRFDTGVETFGVSAGPSNESAFHGVTILDGVVLVADFIADAIHRFSPDGTQLGIFASPPGSPIFLESDSSGNVYTTLFSGSPGSSTSLRFDSSGALTQTFFGGDRGIDADAAGNVYIAGGGQLSKFAPNGALLNSTSLGSINPWDVTIDEAGNLLYMADQIDDTAGIKIFDISGAAPSLLGSITTPANSAIFGVHFAAESGNVLAIDSGFSSNDPRGLEFSPSGMLLREYRATGAQAASDITTFFVIPEPSSAVLVLMGTLAFGFRTRRTLRS